MRFARTVDASHRLLTRRISMRKLFILAAVMLIAAATAFAEGSAEKKPLVFVWYPNESAQEYGPARTEMSAVVEKTLGRPIEHKLTTDYAIAIEALVNKNAALGWFGAEGYIQAHAKNPKVMPLAVNSGSSGTLSDAVYYSWLAVAEGNEGTYKSGTGFSIDNIQGRKFSFVSNSSTSGFRVPSSGIVRYFSKKPGWEKLDAAALIEGGQGKLFSEVLFGGSHQGSAVNLLTGRADVAAFCDTCVANYIEQVSGTHNRPGAVYKGKDGAVAPFDTLVGKRFVLITVTPVLNAPFVYNADLISKADVEKLVAALMSDEVTKNPKIFVPKGAEFKGWFAAGQKFLPVEDAWFNPIRELAQN
jgi:phosphonate transport system substrate-binding protein